MQVVWPAPDLQVDFCCAVALDQRAEVVDQAEVCRRKVNIELPALRPIVKLADRAPGPRRRGSCRAVELIERLSDHREWTAYVIVSRRAFIDRLARQELLEEDQLADNVRRPPRRLLR